MTRAVLDLQKNWADSTETSHITPLPSHRVSSVTNILHHWDTCVPSDEPIWSHHQWKSIVYIQLTFCVVHSMGFNKCIMSHTHHYRTKQFCCPIHPSPSLNHRQPLMFYCLYSFASVSFYENFWSSREHWSGWDRKSDDGLGWLSTSLLCAACSRALHEH